MLELWGMRSTPLLPLIPGLLWLGVVVPDRVLSMGQIELNSVLMLNQIIRNRTFLHLTMCKQKTPLFMSLLFFFILIYKFTNIISL